MSPIPLSEPGNDSGVVNFTTSRCIFKVSDVTRWWDKMPARKGWQVFLSFLTALSFSRVSLTKPYCDAIMQPHYDCTNHGEDEAMKTITIRGIEEKLSEKCKKIAEQDGKSLNQFVLDTLKDRVGFKKTKKHNVVYNDMDHLFGIWSEDDYKTIQDKIDSERKIDKELW